MIVRVYKTLGTRHPKLNTQFPQILFAFRDLTMPDKLMYIPNDDTQDFTSVDYNQWLKFFDTQFNGPTNQNSRKVPKNVNDPMNKKLLL